MQRGLERARFSLGLGGLAIAAQMRQSRLMTSSNVSSQSSEKAASGTKTGSAVQQTTGASLVTSTQGDQRPVAAHAVPRTDALRDTSAPSSSSPRRRRPERGSMSTPGKVKREPITDIKVKKKAPWGVQQLRDSWSEDAMSKRDTENMSERIHREYRYHPDEQWRQWLKITAALTIPCVVIGAALSYYVHTGKAFWHADPQHLLNLIRAPDMSPRSQLYPYRLEETYELPAHVRKHRAMYHETRVLRDRIFAVTHSAFTRLTPEVQRQLDAQAMADANS